MRISALTELKKLRLILVAKDYRQFLLLFICMLGTAALQVTGVASIFPFMQLVAQPGIVEHNEWMGWLYDTAGFTSERQMLLFSGSIVFILFTGSVLVTALTGWLIQRSIWATAHRMCVRQLKIYMQLPYEFFLVNNSTELLRRVVADVNKLLTDVLLAGSLLLAQVSLAIGLFILLFIVSPTISLLGFSAFGVVYLILHLARHSYLVRLGRERIDTDHRRYTTFIDAISGMKAIRAANASRFFVGRFAKASIEYARIYPRLELATNIPRYIMEIFAFGGFLLVVLVLVAFEDDFAQVVPVLSVFALATYRLMPALHTIFESAARLSNSLPVIDSLSQDMRTDRLLEPEMHETPTALTFKHEIRLSEASFQYQSATVQTVRGIELTIEKGKSVALVGATGSGKTTLIDIVMGLLLPTTGSLQIDGVAVEAHNVARWRQLVAYVPQDVFLYDDSVASNISFGECGQDGDDERIRAAARAAQLDEFIMSELKDGYQTMIGERGVRLSGGQRQRLGLARAIYRHPQVLLLDEATSALDNITEESVMTALREALPDVTIIMVAHRLSTVRLCDCIFLVDDGHILDQGSYHELLQTNTLFKQMVDAARVDK